MGSRFYYRVFKNNAVYAAGLALLRAIELFLAPFSLRAKSSFGRLIGHLWYMFDFPNRELFRREMALALGDTLPAYVRRRAQRISMTNMIAYLCEAYFSSSLSQGELLGLVRNHGWEKPLQKALHGGKGAIVLTGHFSNEALLCYLVSAFGHASCVARYQRVFNRLMVSHRKERNLDTLNEFETSYDILLELLSHNEIILATIDRPLKRVKGVGVRFFGHAIIAPYYPVDVARFSGAPIFLAFLTRRDGKYNMHFEGPIHVPQDMDERKAREQYTQLIYSTLEKYIAKYPHEWQWQNKRLIKKDWGVPRYPSGH